MAYYRVSLAVAATAMLSGAAAAAAPTFEIMGFPLTQHQAAMLNSSVVREQAPAPALTLGGMPASPVEIAILSPRKHQETAW